MKKRLRGHIFANHLTGYQTVFEHVSKNGAINYYPCRMKISDGEYDVVLKKGMVVSCWKVKKMKISKLEIQKAFKKLDEKFYEL